MEELLLDNLTPFQKLVVATIVQKTANRAELILTCSEDDDSSIVELLKTIDHEWDNLITICTIEYLFKKYFINASMSFLETGKWTITWKQRGNDPIDIPLEVLWTQEELENRIMLINVAHSLGQEEEWYEEGVLLQLVSPEIVAGLRKHIEISINKRKQWFLWTKEYLKNLIDDAIRGSKVPSIRGEMVVAWWINSWWAQRFLEFFHTQEWLVHTAISKLKKKNTKRK